VTAAKSARGEARRTEVLALARTALVEEGLERFVLREIATQAGMRIGNLQYYFPTREDLLEEVIRAEFDRDLAVVRGVIGDAGPSTPVERLPSIAAGLLDNWCSGGSSVFTALSLLAFHHPRFAQLARQIYSTFYAEIGSLVRSIDPDAGDDDVSARAALITAMLDGVAMQVHTAQCDDATCKDLVTRATTFIESIATG
jgi:AcrR family transcriptional regulator